jgi:hypothetical protein
VTTHRDIERRRTASELQGEQMALDALDHGEKLALVGLVRVMIRLDGEFSEEERELLDGIVSELGEDQFNALAAEVTEKMQDEDSVKYYAERVERPESREQIFGVLYALAIPGSIVPAESALLDWLKERWALETPA